MTAGPPPIEIAHPLRRRKYGILLAVMVLTLILMRLAAAWHVPLPVCGLRKLTGIPCPLCGSTRCLAALSLLDLAGAVRFNPLTFIGGVAAFGWCALGLASPNSAERWVAFLRARIGWAGWIAAFLVVGANWVYLVFNLPR